MPRARLTLVGETLNKGDAGLDHKVGQGDQDQDDRDLLDKEKEKGPARDQRDRRGQRMGDDNHARDLEPVHH